MSFQQKNITVSLVNFSFILGLFIIAIFRMILGGTFISTNVFRLWLIVILLAVFVTIFATIITHIVSAIVQAIRTREENPTIEDFEDERDKWIDLKGTRITYLAASIGGFISMLTFVFGQEPLVMFSLLIFFGLLAQVIGDSARLYLYRRGF